MAVVVCGFPQATAVPPALMRPVQSDRAVGESLVALSLEVGDGRQQITLIDSKSQVMAVYHVDKANGSISLRSVRKIAWDLVMEEFNSANPTPRDIRALAEQR